MWLAEKQSRWKASLPARVVAFSALIGACLWLLTEGTAFRVEAPEIGVEGQGFDAATAPYAKRALEVFKVANKKRSELNALGRSYEWASLAAAWVGFLCTTAITAIAAFFSPMTDPGQVGSAEALKELKKRLRRHAWIIGGLAATAAVAAPLAERSGVMAHQSFTCANELVQLVQETRIRLFDQKPPPGDAEGEGLLDALENKVDQACTDTAK